MWTWDPSLYEGSAGHYVRGRVPYPAALVDLLVAECNLDRTGRLLDLGCGPGSLTVPLAAHVERVVAVDPDEQMLAEGERRAGSSGVSNIEWVHSRAEELSASLGEFRLATLAQSFHWMDRTRVADLLREVLPAGSSLAFVHANTHEGIDSSQPLPFPRPPRAQIEALVTHYLGTRRRAGRGYRELDDVSEDERGRLEARIFRSAGFTGPRRLVVPGWVVERTSDEVVASVLSLSYAAPHLFGDRVSAFEQELRGLLMDASGDGVFSEEMREIAVDVWEA